MSCRPGRAGRAQHAPAQRVQRPRGTRRIHGSIAACKLQVQQPPGGTQCTSPFPAGTNSSRYPAQSTPGSRRCKTCSDLLRTGLFQCQLLNGLAHVFQWVIVYPAPGRPEPWKSGGPLPKAGAALFRLHATSFTSLGKPDDLPSSSANKQEREAQAMGRSISHLPPADSSAVP